MTDAARVYADYFFARNLPLAVMLLLLFVLRIRRMLALIMVLTAVIQIVDVINDLIRGEVSLVPGLLAFSILFLVASLSNPRPSVAGQAEFSGGSLYHATKWGIEGFIEALMPEVAPFNIGLTIVEPGGARTNFKHHGLKNFGIDPSSFCFFQRCFNMRNIIV
jgi:hypothetical protein